MNSKGKVLVTGIAGYIGSFVAYEFLKEGYQVRGTVRDVGNTSKYDYIKTFPHQGDIQIFKLNLESREEIETAVKGCDYIAHVASPVEIDPKLKEVDAIKPAIEGCLFILQAADKYHIKSVVVTGSIAANVYAQKIPEVINGENVRTFDESDWTDIYAKKLNLYAKSKTIEQMKAWEFYRTLDSKNRFKLTFINPSFVIGPFFQDQARSSGMIIMSIMNGTMKAIPDITFNYVDVRDVAICHRLAIETPEADGKRLICTSGYLGMDKICEILRASYPEVQIPTKKGKYILWYILSFCISKINFLLNAWGKKLRLKNDLIRQTLKFSNFISIEESVKKAGQMCIEKKLAKINQKNKQ